METIPMVRLEPGDVVACWGTDWLSRRISLITSIMGGCRYWAPSHVAIIGTYNGQTAWYESTTQCLHPCLCCGELSKSGLQVHPPHYRLNDYLHSGGKVRVYRPSDFDALCLDIDKLNELLRLALEKHLTYSYKGAAISGTNFLRRSRFIPDVDYKDVFCSEFVSLILRTLGLMDRGDIRINPGAMIRQLTFPGTYVLDQEYRG